VGTPTVHLYGPVDSRTFGPWGDPARHIVLTSDRDCIPCNRLDYRADELEDHRCVWDINQAQVIEAARRLLDS
jgi:ADP-heptose:LPS heptosyltransferase